MPKTLEEWSGTMQRVQQMPDGLADIIRDYKIRLPSIRASVL